MEGSDDIICNKFSISRGGKTLFRDAKLSLIHGRRYGLIGPNGCGKSTLMHAIGVGEVDEIRKAIPPGIDILLVEQEVQASEEITALQMVVNADTKRTALLKESKALEETLEKGGVKYIKQAKLEGKSFKVGDHVIFEGHSCTVLEEIDADGDITIQDEFDMDGAMAGRLTDIYDELQDIGADSAEQRASAILSGLQFLEDQKHHPTASFSGGWRMRISLARALFRKPRLLLLDEPTNHLDLHAVVWLEGYLQKWKHTLVVVSHDKDFLCTVCTDMLHCWQKKLVLYSGNYDVYEKVFASKLEEYQKEVDRQQKRLKQLRKEGKVSKDLGKKDGGADSASYKKQMQQVLGPKSQKGKELASFGGGGGSDEEEDGLLEAIKHVNMHITFPVAGEIPMPILAVDMVDFNYVKEEEEEDGTKVKKVMPTLFRAVDFGLNMDSRVALVGANGTGKSTLLKLMLGELEPVRGEVRLSRMCKIGVYSQHSCDQLTKTVKLAKGMTLTPVAYLQHQFIDLDEQTIRNALGKFGLEGHHHLQDMNTLSGGQKSRVVFVELGLRRCHLLLLDEPTNHLDLETVDCLVKGLRRFEGGVLVITHNVSLINAVCNEIWVLDEQKVNVFPGEFEDYRDDLAVEMSKIFDEDPEEKRRERERAEAALIKKERDAAAAAGGVDPSKPKSKAMRDAERKEARAAKAAKDKAEEEAKAKREAEAKELAHAEAEAELKAQRQATEATLERTSLLAKEAIAARAIPIDELFTRMLAAGPPPLEVCGGLLALTQDHKPIKLIAPFTAAVLRLKPTDAAKGAIEGETEGAVEGAVEGAEPCSPAERIDAWRLPLGWLICRCDDLEAAQLELLSALEPLVGADDTGPLPLKQAAPTLKALWECQLLEDKLLLQWRAAEAATAGGRRLRKFAQPFLEWLENTPISEEIA